MRQYELTYLISDVVPEADLNKVTGKIGGYISALKGEIEKEEIWGRRKLAYPIKKQDFATYVTLNFNILPENAAEFEREIRLTNEVIRHLMIVKEYGKEELTLTAEEIAENADITEVVGSEKSFEAVEGETEESKDLMSVRESEEKEEVEVKPEVKAEEKEEPKAKEKKTKSKTEEKVAPVKESKEEKAVETTEEPAEKKKKAKPELKKDKAAKETKSDEAERLSKLNDELDDILKDEL